MVCLVCVFMFACVHVCALGREFRANLSSLINKLVYEEFEMVDQMPLECLNVRLRRTLLFNSFSGLNLWFL